MLKLLSAQLQKYFCFVKELPCQVVTYVENRPKRL